MPTAPVRAADFKLTQYPDISRLPVLLDF